MARLPTRQLRSLWPRLCPGLGRPEKRKHPSRGCHTCKLNLHLMALPSPMPCLSILPSSPGENLVVGALSFVGMRRTGRRRDNYDLCDHAMDSQPSTNIYSFTQSPNPPPSRPSAPIPILLCTTDRRRARTGPGFCSCQGCSTPWRIPPRGTVAASQSDRQWYTS